MSLYHQEYLTPAPGLCTNGVSFCIYESYDCTIFLVLDLIVGQATSQYVTYLTTDRGSGPSGCGGEWRVRRTV